MKIVIMSIGALLCLTLSGCCGGEHADLVVVNNSDRDACSIVLEYSGSTETVQAADGSTLLKPGQTYGLELEEEVVNIGSPMKPNVELVLGSEPDLIIASSLSPSNLELKETFDNAGIPAAYFDVSSFQDYLDLLELCTRLTGRPENYETYGAAVQAQVDGAVDRRSVYSFAPTVLTIQVSGSSVKVKNSRDNVLGPILADLGCVNIADRDGSLLEDLSLETILQADPDFIFAVYHGTDEEAARANLEESLLSNPAWASLGAVEGERFHILDRRMYSLKPNALWGDAYEQLADILWKE